jgi:hypothetical protein
VDAPLLNPLMQSGGENEQNHIYLHIPLYIKRHRPLLYGAMPFLNISQFTLYETKKSHSTQESHKKSQIALFLLGL